MDDTKSDADVTFVTRNDRAAIIEMVLYVGFLWAITHPDQMEQVKGKLEQWRDRALYKISVWQTRGAIQSLPETEPDA